MKSLPSPQWTRLLLLVAATTALITILLRLRMHPAAVRHAPLPYRPIPDRPIPEAASRDHRPLETALPIRRAREGQERSHGALQESALQESAFLQSAMVDIANWSVPERYRGQLVRQRVSGFPTKLLALTFDDGPDPAITPRILKTLAGYRAHATFFVVGRHLPGHTALLKQMVAAGHAVGNHSYTHPIHVSAAQAEQELQQTETAIVRTTGRPPTCFRPPYGIIGNRLTQRARAQQYAVILWTISSADTRPISANVLANNVIHTPATGDIVLMHDGPGHQTTAEALPQILKELDAAGYRFVTVPELLQAWDAWVQSPAHSR